MRSNVRLSGWRSSYHSIPNIHEAVDNEYSLHLHQNPMTPWRNLRTRWEDPLRGRQKPPFSSGFTSFDEPGRSEHKPSSFLFWGRTRSVPEALHSFGGPALRPSFSSISVTARSLSPKRDCTAFSTSSLRSLKMPDRPPLFISRSENKTLQTIALRPVSPAVVVTVTKHHCTNEIPSNPQTSPDHCNSYTDDEVQTDFSSPSKQHIFRSCVHFKLLPPQLSKSTLYLDKSLSIPLGRTLYRSTLSHSLGKESFSQTTKEPETMIQPKRSCSDCDMVNTGVDGKEMLSQHLKDGATINGSTFKNNTSSSSDMWCSSLTSLPFRTRCHSSSAAFRLNGKANDVLGPPQSNPRARQAFSEPSGVSEVRVRAPHEVRAVSQTAERVRRLIEWPVSPHMTNCTCGSRTDQQDTEPQSLSLREALELFRPDFISRSQNRVRRLELRARERRSLQTAEFIISVETANRRRNWTKPHPLSDNLFKPRDRVISGKEMQWRSRRIYNKLPEVAKKKEEERKRLVSETNRLRAEVFKKKLLDQILQRHGD